MTLRQYRLENENASMICWLEDGRVKVGDRVTLRDSDDDAVLWQVKEAFSATDSSHINRGWGMTDMPRRRGKDKK